MAVDLNLETISSGYNISKINTNFQAIDVALQDAVSRSGHAPNQMDADFDMNGNDILNVDNIDVNVLTIDGVPVTVNGDVPVNPDALVPVGGADGQVLTKTSSVDYETAWETLPVVHELPVAGTAGQLLAKNSGTDYDVEWIDTPESLPAGGTDGQVLTKQSGTDYDVDWEDTNTQPIVANTMLVDNAAGTLRENKTFSEVRTLLEVPTEIEIPSLVPLRNYVKNGNFEFYRSATSQSSSGYGSDDDWRNHNNGSTKVHTLNQFVIGQTDVPGEPKRYSSTVVTSVANAANYVFKENALGRVADLGGRTITLTLWGKADASKNIAAEIRTNYGTGGSPSATETFAVQVIPLTTSWAKKTYALVLPSISGKTLGTNEDDFVGLNLWFDAGSSFNSRTGSLGQQSGTFDIAQVSVLVGDHTAVDVPWNNFPRQGISSVGFGRYRPGLANVYSTIDFYRNPGTAMVTGVSAAAWAWPGTALTASTHSIPVGARMKLVQAIWWLIWNPNSAGAGTAVRLVTADAGPTNIVALKQLATVTGSTPRNDSNDITPEMRAYLLAPETGTNRKTIGQQVFGDGAAGPLIYASWIECLWDISPD